MDLQEKIKDLEKEFNEKIEILKSEAQQEQEFPKIGRRFYVITTEGKVIHERWEDDGWDRSALSIDNVFKTKEQAEFAVEKLKVEAELRKFSRPFEHEKFNYYLFFDIDGNSIVTDFTGYCPPQGAIYFESEEKAQEAVSAVGEERIKKYIFGMED